MEKFKSIYSAKQVNVQGNIDFTRSENRVWNILIERQLKMIQNKGCCYHKIGLDKLNYPTNVVPNVTEINERLLKITGWRFKLVPTLVEVEQFFEMLSNKQFPVISHIRPFKDLDYIPEPDCFHEFFGHGPFLTDPLQVTFLEQFANIFLSSSFEDRLLLQRYFWLTIEFGLIQELSKLKIFGAGILASYSETPYSINSNQPIKRPYDPVSIFRTPYRMDIPQPIYYILPSVKVLLKELDHGFESYIEQARELGEFKPLFSTKDINPMNVHINWGL